MVYLESSCWRIQTTSEMLEVVDMPVVVHSHTSSSGDIFTPNCKWQTWDHIVACTPTTAADKTGI